MTLRWEESDVEMWRERAARLRQSAAAAGDPLNREQLLVFAEDCEEQAAAAERLARSQWLRA